MRIVNPVEERGWDAGVAAAGGSAFESSGWARALADSYGFEPRYLAAFSGDVPDLLLPMMEVRSRLTGRRGVSLPFSDHCAAVYRDASGARSLYDAALEEGRRRGWKYYELRDRYGLGLDLPVSSRFLAHRLDLTPGAEAILKKTRRSTRWNLRRSADAGVRGTIETDADAMETFYRLHCQNRRRHGVPPPPLRFMRAVYTHLVERGQGFLAVARVNGDAVCADVVLVFGRWATFKWCATADSAYALRPAYAVVAESIKRSCDLGLENFCFGRTDPDNTGLAQFKTGWRPEECEVSYSRYAFASGRHVRDQAHTTGAAGPLFRAMPLWMLKAVGSALYRHMG